MKTPLDLAVEATQQRYRVHGSEGAVEEAFTASAIATWKALRSGVSAKALGEILKQRAGAGADHKRTPVYTSPTSVLYHGRTGWLLTKAGPSPMPALDIQTLVRTATDSLGTRVVERLIGRATTQRNAVEALQAAMKARPTTSPQTTLTLALLNADVALDQGVIPNEDDVELARRLLRRMLARRILTAPPTAAAR